MKSESGFSLAIASQPFETGEDPMALPSLFLVLLLSILFVSDHLLHADMRKKGESARERRALTTNHEQQKRVVVGESKKECQTGDPLGFTYSGDVNITASGLDCQVWANSRPLGNENALLKERSKKGDFLHSPPIIFFATDVRVEFSSQK